MNIDRVYRSVILAYNSHCESLINKISELQQELNYIQCGECKKTFKDSDRARNWCKRCNKMICYRCSTLAGSRLNDMYCYSCVVICESGSFCVNVRPMIPTNEVQICADCGCKLCNSCAIEHNGTLCTACLADNYGLAKCGECKIMMQTREAIYMPQSTVYMCTECAYTL